ncbi:solute carrier family 22 member 4 [Elysia marginata]|uniref:Solute carrier family 22 member 4 n=1 Tax=Elysia marginata TaxID=1093978 RepID=A0AAV4IDW9_9GAST|nr:solute carrier family 22 member 4 [Elysia marginata]
MEFMTPKWRPICGSYPAWPFGVCFFSLSAYLLQDWRYIQVACGVCGLLVIPLLFLVPESLRWLTVQGRLDEAQATIDKIARWNGKPPVLHAKETLRTVYEQEKRAREGGQRYTYIDVFKSWKNAKITTIMSYHWFCYSLVYYGIAFGVSSLAGNIFFNILLLGIIDLPPTMSTIFFNRVLGRKWTAAPAVTISLSCLLVCMVLQILGLGGDKSHVITGLSLVAKASVTMAWMTIMTWGSELYPTVIRNLGFGIANTASRIAGIVGPFVLNFDTRLTLSYCILATGLVLDLVLIALLPDTKNKMLQDSISTHTQQVDCDRSIAPDSKVVEKTTPNSSCSHPTFTFNSSPEKAGTDMSVYPGSSNSGELSTPQTEVAYMSTDFVYDEEKGTKL